MPDPAPAPGSTDPSPVTDPTDPVGPLLTVLGEAVIDLVPHGEPGGYRARPCGSPFNVAVGLARLGHRTALMARLADNAFGRQLRAYGAREGLDLTPAPHAAEPTTLAVISLDEQARAEYDFYLDGTADWQWTAAEAARVPADTAVCTSAPSPRGPRPAPITSTPLRPRATPKTGS
ncbi:MAG TPA: PfkB family carbohydrate kinase [Actinocrinis sp.]|nr:PfkB family carbohydrate kinase [Actinocrinis sp.]